MATKEVVLNGNVIMTVRDTTAIESDVAQGKIFYKSNGDRAIGTYVASSSSSGSSSSSQPQVTNGFIANNNNLNAEVFYNWNQSENYGTLMHIGDEIQGNLLADRITYYKTIGDNKKRFNISLNYYEDGSYKGMCWVQPEVEVKRSTTSMPINDGSEVRWFYATPTIRVLDTNGDVISNEKIGQQYYDKTFVFTSFDYIAYTIQQAEDFITQNNVYYKSEDERQALISQITTYLAKSETLVFTQLSEKGTENDPYSAQEAYSYIMEQSGGNGPYEDGSLKYVSDVVKSVAKGSDGKTYNITLGEDSRAMIQYWSGETPIEGNTILVVGNLKINKAGASFVIINNASILSYGNEQEPLIVDPENPEVVEEEKGLTIENPLTSTEAIEIASGLESGKKTENSYYISGTVSEITNPFNSTYKNISFKLDGSEFIVSRLQVESEEIIKIGTKVVVYGQIENYNGKYDTIKPELIEIVE